MTRILRTTLVGAAALLALAAACNKDEKKEGAAPGATDQPVPAKTGFAVFPASTNMIGGVNLATARSSAIWNQYKAQIEAAMTEDVADFKTVCGIDPFTQLQSAMIGGNSTTQEIVAVVKGIGRAELKSCGEKMAAQKGKQLGITDEGNLSLYQSDGREVWGAWLDDKTVIFSPKKDKTFIAQRAAGEAGLDEGAEVMKLLKNVDTSATLYLVATAASVGENPVAAMMQGAQGFFASFKLTEGLAIDGGVRFDTADNSKNFTTMLQGQIQAMKGQQVPPQLAGVVKIVQKATVEQNGTDTIVKVNITGPELQELATMLTQVASAFGGQLGQ